MTNIKGVIYYIRFLLFSSLSNNRFLITAHSISIFCFRISNTVTIAIYRSKQNNNITPLLTNASYDSLLANWPNIIIAINNV